MGFFDHLPRTPSTMSVIYDILSFTLVLLFPVFSYPISAPSLFATTTRTRAFRLFSLSNTVVSSVAFPLFLLLQVLLYYFTIALPSPRPQFPCVVCPFAYLDERH